MICPNCNGMIEEFKGKYICTKCEMFYKQHEIIDSSQQTWYQRACNRESLWYQDAFYTYPSIIAHEYFRFYELLQNGQTYGAFLQLKDVLEVLIKFPSLLGASEIYHKKVRSEEENKVLISLLEKPLSLGDWERISAQIKSLRINSKTKILLEKILTIYRKFTITNWRNEKLGHGALSFDISTEFQEDMLQKVKMVRDYMVDCAPIYKDFPFYLLKDQQQIFLQGKENDGKAMESSSSLYISINGQQLPLYPYILLDQGRIYFFDSYYIRKRKTALLNYPEGIKQYLHKSVNDDLEALHRGISISSDVSSIDNDTSVEDESYSQLDEKILHKIQEVDDFQKPEYMEEWIKKNLEYHRKGIFLIQMERGLGKTTFSRSLDQQSLHQIKLPGFSVRTYYINDNYAYKVKHFLLKANDLLRQNKDGDTVIHSAYYFQHHNVSRKHEFANMLNQFHQEHIKYFGNEKLLFVIDGMDEIPSKESLSIFDYVPDVNMLHDGVYLLLTSRTNEEMSHFNCSRMVNLQFTNHFIINRENDQHKKTLKNYLETYFGQILKPEDQMYLISTVADSRFLYLKLLKELLSVSEEINLSNLPKGESLFTFYLDKLQSLYGEKYFRKVVQLLMILSTSYEPLSLKEISTLLGDERPTFKLLAYLLDIRGVLRIERSPRGNVMTISHDLWTKVIREKYNDKIHSLVSAWVEQCLSLSTHQRENYHWEYEDNDGWTYLISYLFDYCGDYLEDQEPFIGNNNYKELLLDVGNTLMRKSYKEYHFNRLLSLSANRTKIHKHTCKTPEDTVLLSKALFFQGTVLQKLSEFQHSLDLYEEVIHIRKELDEQGYLKESFLLATPLIKRGKLRIHFMELEKALDDFTKAIKVIKSISYLNSEVKNEMASAYMSRGITQFNLGELEKSIEDYDLAIELRLHLQKVGELEDPSDLPLVYMNRGVAFSELQLNDKALIDFNEAIHWYRELKKHGTLYNANDYAVSLMNRSILYYKQLKEGHEFDTENNNLLQDEVTGRLINSEEFDLSELEEVEFKLKDIELFGNNELDEIEFKLDDTEMNSNELYGISIDESDKTKILSDLNEAIHIFRELKEQGYYWDLNDYMKAILNRGVILYELDDEEEALQDFNEVVELLELAKKTDQTKEVEYIYALMYRSNTFTYFSKINLAINDYQLIVESLLSIHSKGIGISSKVVTKLRNKLIEIFDCNQYKEEVENLLQSINLVPIDENRANATQDWLLQALEGKKVAMHVKLDLGSIQHWALL